MAKEVAGIIERWFRDHSEDEFYQSQRGYPYQIVGPPKNTKRILFATKSSIVFRDFEDSPTPNALGIIAQGGLPNFSDVDWLADVVGTRELLFLGDMDPVDLMIFAWLRARLPSVHITYFGISDSFLSKLCCRIPESFRIQLSPAELAAVPVVEQELLELPKTVGPECFALLKQGYKIELEAVVTALKTAASILSLAAYFQSS
jgi:hypothetical protein